MAKRKYQKKNEVTVPGESLVENEDNISVEKAQEAAVIITKKAKRRAKAQAEVVSQNTAKTDKSTSKVVTSDQYKSMSSKRKPAAKKSTNKRKGVESNDSIGKRSAAWFRAMKAELKAVTWPPFKTTPKVTGVWSNIATVLLVVFFFLIVVTAFDSGLTSLFRLLVGIGNK